MITDARETPVPPPAWLRTVAAAALLTVLYFALDTASVELSLVAGRPGALAALAAVLVGAALAVAALRSTVAAGIDEPSVRAQVLGTSRPRRAIVPLLVAVVTMAVAAPILVVLAQGLGLQGGTALPRVHYSPELAALIALESIVLAPWMEEVSMRGLLFTGLLRRFGFWPAALLSGFAWAALHRAPLVLIAFTVAGVALAWLRKRTGSVRWGIGVHGAWNTFAASLLLGWWAGLGIAVLAATLMLARDDLRGRPLTAVRGMLRGPAMAVAAVARRLPGSSPAGLRAIGAAGVLLGAGIALEAVDRYRIAGIWADHSGRLAIAAGSLLLAVAAAGSPARWRIDRRTALVGVAGGVLAAAAHIGTAAGMLSLSAANALGYVLIAWWLWQVGGGSGAVWTVRLGARVAALGMLLSVVPPTRSGAWWEGSSLILLVVAAVGLCLVGAAPRLHPDPAPGRIWAAASSAVSRRGWSDTRWGWATVAAAVVVAAAVIGLPQPAARAAAPSACAPRAIRMSIAPSLKPGSITGRIALTARRACTADAIRVGAALASPAGRTLPSSLIGVAAVIRWRGVVRPHAAVADRVTGPPFTIRGLRFCRSHPAGPYTLVFTVAGGRARARFPFVCRH